MIEDVQWFVGIDWATQNHRVCLLDIEGGHVNERDFAHGGVGLTELRDWLLEKTKAVPAQIDGALFVLIGIAISTQPLLYGMTRQLVDAQNAGKALSAINLAFFLGAALMQSSTGVVATIFGLPAVLLFMAATLIAGTIVFLIYT